MTTQPEVVRHSELLNQLVLDRNTMEELGRIEVLWMYPQVHRVLGFVCKSGFLGNRKTAFKLSQVDTFGSNGILTHSPPEDTDAERVRQLESLIGCEVWSRVGDRVGKVFDCVFNLRTGLITDYLIVADQWGSLVGTIYRLPPGKILSFGRRRVLVVETTIQSFDTYREGIPEKLHKVSHELKEDYTQVTQELRSFTHKAQSFTEQAKGRFQSLTARAKERAQSLAEQARETAHLLNEQLWETGEDLIEQVKERTHDLSEQVKEGTQTLTVQAREVIDSVRDDLALDDDDLMLDDDLFDTEDEETVPATVPPVTHPPQPPTTAIDIPSATAPTATITDDYCINENLELIERPPMGEAGTPAVEDTSDDDDPWIDDEPVIPLDTEATIATPSLHHPRWANPSPQASDFDDDDDLWLYGDDPVVTAPSMPTIPSVPQTTPAKTDEDDDEPWI